MKKKTELSDVDGHEIYLKGGVEYGEVEKWGILKGIFKDVILPILIGFFVIGLVVCIGFVFFKTEIVRIIFVMFFAMYGSWVIGCSILGK